MPKTKTSAKPLAAFSVAAKKRCSLNDPDLNNDIVEETRIGPASNLQDEDHFPCADLSNADAGEISTSAFHLQERKQKLMFVSSEMQPIAGRTEPPHPVKYHYADTFWCIYITSVVSACIAELATYPLDLTKTRLQIQGEALTANIHNAKKVHSHRGMVATALGIVREEGSLKLWQGVTPALYRHVVYSGCRIVVYDNLRKKLGSTGQVGIPLYQSAICGITAGGLAQWLASPADLVKVQVQMEGKRRLMGLPPRVHSAAHAFMEIVRRGGIKGLWKGSIPNVQRAALVNLGDLTTYDHIKRTIITKTGLPDSHTVHILSSICAGLVAAGMGTPADVVKTRVMNQPTDNNGRGLLYRGAIDCLRQTVSKEGFFALYKGFLPVWIRMAPWSLTFWMSFEEIRRMLGTNSY